ncbi:hypothetical protein BKA62DRAFT_160115 [Auriculariales sp. MPI-PUGE-AT-0066]|nr:hypothetical protein BKA62DRAFT_160115 [Auriculariales sp. MPI-PUGE-AT-0066]
MAPPTKYATEQEKREARNASKKRYYERHRESEQEKARQRWRARKERERDDLVPGTSSSRSPQEDELLEDRSHIAGPSISHIKSNQNEPKHSSPEAAVPSMRSPSQRHQSADTSLSPGPHMVPRAGRPPIHVAVPSTQQAQSSAAHATTSFHTNQQSPVRPSSPSDRFLHPSAQRQRQLSISPTTSTSPTAPTAQLTS